LSVLEQPSIIASLQLMLHQLWNRLTSRKLISGQPKHMWNLFVFLKIIKDFYGVEKENSSIQFFCFILYIYKMSRKF